MTKAKKKDRIMLLTPVLFASINYRSKKIIVKELETNIVSEGLAMVSEAEEKARERASRMKAKGMPKHTMYPALCQLDVIAAVSRISEGQYLVFHFFELSEFNKIVIVAKNKTLLNIAIEDWKKYKYKSKKAIQVKKVGRHTQASIEDSQQ